MTGLQHPFMVDETSLIRLTIMCSNRYQTPSLLLFRRSLQTTPATLLFEALDLWFCYPLADQSNQSTFAKHRKPSAWQYADPLGKELWRQGCRGRGWSRCLVPSHRNAWYVSE